MFDDDIIDSATRLLERARAHDVKIATAESCTGGLIIGALTEIAGSSDVVDRGFITYSNEAKMEMLGVTEAALKDHGAVSEVVARAMADGVLNNSPADLCVAVTGVAGPGASDKKPEGMVHFACTLRDTISLHRLEQFGAIGRKNVRLETVRTALDLMHKALDRVEN